MTIDDAAQSFEGSLMIMRKAKEGWVFGFAVHPNDAPHGILDSSVFFSRLMTTRSSLSPRR